MSKTRTYNDFLKELKEIGDIRSVFNNNELSYMIKSAVDKIINDIYEEDDKDDINR